MDQEKKPTVVVSKCLGFEPCRYNGQILSDHLIFDLKPYVNFIPVCPECEIGLGIPREPIRIVLISNELRLYQSTTLTDLTDRMQYFMQSFFASLPQVDGFILKSKSPSCGLKDTKIYKSVEKSKGSNRGSGLFGKFVIERYYMKAVEDEGRLTNLRIREHFLTKLFTLYKFRTICETNSPYELAKFHANNKLLFMAYNQKELRLMNSVLTNRSRKAFITLSKEYEFHLTSLFTRLPRCSSICNVLYRMSDYFSDVLGKEEKDFIYMTIEKYKNDQFSLTVPLYLLKSYALRYGETYLLDQSIFHPYPEDLINISDSGHHNIIIN